MSWTWPSQCLWVPGQAPPSYGAAGPNHSASPHPRRTARKWMRFLHCLSPHGHRELGGSAQSGGSWDAACPVQTLPLTQGPLCTGGGGGHEPLCMPPRGTQGHRDTPGLSGPRKQGLHGRPGGAPGPRQWVTDTRGPSLCCEGSVPTAGPLLLLRVWALATPCRGPSLHPGCGESSTLSVF